jgi:hypothetical protein
VSLAYGFAGFMRLALSPVESLPVGDQASSLGGQLCALRWVSLACIGEAGWISP